MNISRTRQDGKIRQCLCHYNWWSVFIIDHIGHTGIVTNFKPGSYLRKNREYSPSDACEWVTHKAKYGTNIRLLKLIVTITKSHRPEVNPDSYHKCKPCFTTKSKPGSRERNEKLLDEINLSHKDVKCEFEMLHEIWLARKNVEPIKLHVTLILPHSTTWDILPFHWQSRVFHPGKPTFEVCIEWIIYSLTFPE